MAESDITEVAVIIVIVGVTLFIGVSIFSTMAEQTVEVSDNGERVQTATVLDGSGTWNVLGQTTGRNETVLNSRGYAVDLAGTSDSYIQSDADIDVAADANYTLATWASVDQASVAENMTVLALDGRLVLTYNGSASEWRAWYYDEGSRDSYQAAVSAPNQPGNLTHLTAIVNSTDMTLYRNNTVSDTVDLTQSESVSAPINATTFDGRIEETRTFDGELTNSERGELVNQPLKPQPDQTRTSRIMYDEPYRDSQLILHSGASLTTSNVSYASGFSGSEVAAENYTINVNGPRLKVDTATNLPVAYVDYTIQSLGPGTIIGSLSNALVYMALLPFLLIVGVILHNLETVQTR